MDVTVVNTLCGQDSEYSQAVPAHGASTTTFINVQPSGFISCTLPAPGPLIIVAYPQLLLPLYPLSNSNTSESLESIGTANTLNLSGTLYES